MRSLEEIASQWPNEAARLAKVTGISRKAFEAWMIELEAEHQKARRPYGKKPLAEITPVLCAGSTSSPTATIQPKPSKRTCRMRNATVSASSRGS